MEPLPSVVLVNPPFASVDKPSLGLGSLQAVLKRDGIEARTLYLNLVMAEYCIPRVYEQMAKGPLSSPEHLFGEWLFSPWLWSDEPSRADLEIVGPDRSFVRRAFGATPYRPKGFETSPIGFARVIRGKIPRFLKACLEAYDWSNVRLLGFTSSFQQHVCSLVLGRLIKKTAPGLVMVMGGANVEGEMGRATLEAFPWVDCVVSGEGEEVITPLARAVLSGQEWRDTPGVMVHGSAGPTVPPPPVDMDGLPYPDYDDYFRELDRHPIPKGIELCIPAETSRGCWWGEKCQCTFCGLNGQCLRYRHKSPDRAFREIGHLWSKYGRNMKCIALTDNNAPVHVFSRTPEFAQLGRTGVRLACEIKVNLTKEQVSLLREAGFRQVQPGVESLSTKVLKLMRKGSSALMNVQLLKWLLEYDIDPHWNLIWGFPGEEASEYKKILDLIPRLMHLPPPSSQGRVRLDRFSPLFKTPDSFGICNIRPKDSYRYVYKGLSPDTIGHMSYFFDFDYAGTAPDGCYDEVRNAIFRWKSRHGHAGLFYFPAGTLGILVDTRFQTSIYTLGSSWLELLDALDAVTSLDDLSEKLAASPAVVEAGLEVLERKGWALRRGRNAVGLALRLGEYQPSPGVIQRLSELLDEGGTILRPVGHIEEEPFGPRECRGRPGAPAADGLTVPRRRQGDTREGRSRFPASLFRADVARVIRVERDQFARALADAALAAQAQARESALMGELPDF